MSEKENIPSLKERSQTLIKGYREAGSEGSRLKKSISFDMKKETEFSELSSRAFAHQGALLYIIAKYEKALESRIKELEKASATSLPVKMKPDLTEPQFIRLTHEPLETKRRIRYNSETTDSFIDENKSDKNEPDEEFVSWLESLPAAKLAAALEQVTDND